MKLLLCGVVRGNQGSSHRPVTARKTAVAVVAALIAVMLTGCHSGSDSSAAATSSARSSPSATSTAAQVSSSECVFGGQVGACKSTDPTAAKALVSNGDCSTTQQQITVNWGDSSAPVTVNTVGPATANTPKVIADHTFSSPGVYTITITGSTSGPCTFTPTTDTFTYAQSVTYGHVKCSASEPSECLLASDGVSGLDAGEDAEPPAGMTLKDQEVDSDGFAAAEFEDDQDDIIIANEDADLASPFGSATAYQNSSLIAEAAIYKGVSPAALNSAVQFSRKVAGTDKSAHIYVTGFGLGGAEAQAEAQDPRSAVTGGVTFGAPGLPGHQVSGGEAAIANIVDFGDPVGNWASDPESELASVAPANMDHYGGVDLVGNPLSAALPRFAANAHQLLSDNALDGMYGDYWSVRGPIEKSLGIEPLPNEELVDYYDTAMQTVYYSFLAGSALIYHSIKQYAQDLGVSLALTVAPAISMAEWEKDFDPAASTTALSNADETTVSPQGAVNGPGDSATDNDTTDLITSDTFAAGTGSQDDVSYDQAGQISSLRVNDPSGTSYEIFNDDANQNQWSTSAKFYSGPDETGKLTGILYNWRAGGSQLRLFAGLPNGESAETFNYSQPDATGDLIGESPSAATPAP